MESAVIGIRRKIIKIKRRIEFFACTEDIYLVIIEIYIVTPTIVCSPSPSYHK